MSDRRPSYESTLRFAQMLLLIAAAGPCGIRQRDLWRQLGCTERTLYRYLAIATERLVDPTATDQSCAPLERGVLWPDGTWEPGGDYMMGCAGVRIRLAPGLAGRLASGLAPWVIQGQRAA